MTEMIDLILTKYIPPDPEKDDQGKAPPFGLETVLSKRIMDKLWEYISIAKKNPKSYNSTLAGNISSSLSLDDTDNWFFEQTILLLSRKFQQGVAQTNLEQARIFKMGVAPSVPVCMSDFWVNFMKQHEFNPLHNHAGLYSFVIFMKIPYDWREQYEIPFVKHSNNPAAGNFEFVVPNMMGPLPHRVPYKLDSSFEGTMLFFPAEIGHTVYPFYNCEEERITISGNIVYDI